MADENNTDPQPEQGIDKRVSSLEAGQESLTQKIDKILGLVGGGHADEPSDDDGQPAHGGSIAHEIRAQLDERDRRAKADADKQSTADELAAVKTRLAELSEKPPEPMPRRVEKWMGWR